MVLSFSDISFWASNIPGIKAATQYCHRRK